MNVPNCDSDTSSSLKLNDFKLIAISLTVGSAIDFPSAAYDKRASCLVIASNVNGVGPFDSPVGAIKEKKLFKQKWLILIDQKYY